MFPNSRPSPRATLAQTQNKQGFIKNPAEGRLARKKGSRLGVGGHVLHRQEQQRGAKRGHQFHLAVGCRGGGVFGQPRVCAGGVRTSKRDDDNPELEPHSTQLFVVLERNVAGGLPSSATLLTNPAFLISPQSFPTWSIGQGPQNLARDRPTDFSLTHVDGMQNPAWQSVGRRFFSPDDQHQTIGALFRIGLAEQRQL